MVDRTGDYPRSSSRSNAGATMNPLLSPHPIYLALGDTPENRAQAYGTLFDRHLEPQAIQAIRDFNNSDPLIPPLPGANIPRILDVHFQLGIASLQKKSAGTGRSRLPLFFSGFEFFSNLLSPLESGVAFRKIRVGEGERQD